MYPVVAIENFLGGLAIVCVGLRGKLFPDAARCGGETQALAP
tara:strand:- start:574 stop:699 length:126 start_codon:yes stop_codon:yes gene_type:complete